jgi:hypothetical protein
MVRRPGSRHARPSGRAEVAAAYERTLADLTAVRSARWNDQMETIRLTVLTEQVTTQVATLQQELMAVRAELQVTRQELQAARSVPPVVVEVPSGGWSAVTPPAWSPQPYVHPDAAPQPAPAASSLREDLLLQEMAELRRLVAHQQTLLADLTVRLLDLLARFIPVAPPQYAYPAPPPAAAPGAPAPAPPAYPAAPVPTLAPDDLVMDDETATRLRVIREAFGR